MGSMSNGSAPTPRNWGWVGYDRKPMYAIGAAGILGVAMAGLGLVGVAANGGELFDSTNTGQSQDAGGSNGGGDPVASGAPSSTSSASPSASANAGSTAASTTGTGADSSPDASKKPHRDTSPQPGSSAGAGTSGRRVYIIRSGDTLAQISGRCGVPLDTLVEINDIQNPNVIFAGAALLLKED